MDTPSIKKVSKERLDELTEERNMNSMKGQMFNEFDAMEPGGDAIEVNVADKDGDPDQKKLQYVRSLASMYNRNEAEGKRIRTKTNSDKTVAFAYAEEE